MALVGYMEEILEGYRIVLPDDISAEVEVVKGGDTLCVEGRNGRYKIQYSQRAEFFRGVSILKNKIETKETDFHIEQKRNFSSCGAMLDVSRNAVLSIASVKRFIVYMAKMGLNMLMLYTEDIYQMEKYPYFGHMRGAYSKEELKEIVRFADMFGIEVIPCIQTLAHLSKTLRWAAFDDMKESEDILFVGEKETYELIEEMIKTMRECFTTSKIHIGMDEAHGVGLGAYLNKHGYTNRFEILSSHLSEVMKITQKYGFEPMMWSDMFFRLGSKSGGYYDLDVQLPENIAQLVPKGITQVYWDYYNHSEELYDFMFTEHKKLECPIAFAGGVWTWSGPAANYRQTFDSTKPALDACLAHGISDVVATLWGDDGSECSVFEALYGLQLYAEYNYHGSDESIDEMFYICTGAQADAFKLFDIDNFKDQVAPQESAYSFGTFESYISMISKQALYQNPLMGLFDKNFAMTDLNTHFTKILKQLEALPEQGEFEELFECHKQLVRILAEKADLGIRIKNAYDKKDTDELCALAETAEVLTLQITKFHEMRENLWYHENKPFGFEAVSMRLKEAEAACNRTAKRIKAFLCKEISELEELEQERLYYNGAKRPNIIEYFSDKIIML